MMALRTDVVTHRRRFDNVVVESTDLVEVVVVIDGEVAVGLGRTYLGK